MSDAFNTYKNEVLEKTSDSMVRASRKADNIIIFLSNSMIVLTAGYLFTSDRAFRAIFLIELSWILFAAAISSIIISLHFVQRRNRRIATTLKYKESSEFYDPDPDNRSTRPISLFDTLSKCFFILAILTLVSFLIINLDMHERMEQAQKESKHVLPASAEEEEEEGDILPTYTKEGGTTEE